MLYCINTSSLSFVSVAATLNRKSGKRYRCQYCVNSYDIASSYYNHVRNTHGKDSEPASCNLCSGIFKNRDSLLRHLRLYHTGPDAGKMHICHYCGAKYNLKGGLVSHLKHAHDKVDKALDDALKKCKKVDDETEPVSKKSKKSQIKKEVVTNKKRRRNSYSKEKKGKDFFCHICGAGFTQKSSMYRHVRMNHKGIKVHTNVKNVDTTPPPTTKKFKCKICSNTYSSRQSLANHCQIKHKKSGSKVVKKADKNENTSKCTMFK